MCKISVESAIRYGPRYASDEGMGHRFGDRREMIEQRIRRCAPRFHRILTSAIGVPLAESVDRPAALARVAAMFSRLWPSRD